MWTNVSSYDDENPIPNLPDDPIVRTVVLVEKTEIHEGEEKIVLVEWELASKEFIQNSASMPILITQREVIIDGEQYVVIAERFQDPVNWIVRLNDTERWHFINLTAGTHPMHVHLVQFKAVARSTVALVNADYVLSNGDCVDTTKIVEVVDCKSNASEPIEVSVTGGGSLDDNELGLKDTIRVNPGEMVEIVATFEGYCGRYVYHCHLLEHEDHDMMRQFIVTRDDMTGKHGMPVSVGSQ